MMLRPDDTPMRRMRLSQDVPLTVREVADLVRQGHGLRCTGSHISAIERGVRGMSPKLAVALADIYGTTREQLHLAYYKTRGVRTKRKPRTKRTGRAKQ